MESDGEAVNLIVDGSAHIDTGVIQDQRDATWPREPSDRCWGGGMASAAEIAKEYSIL